MGARIRTSSHGLDSPRDTDWRDQAACRDVDPELFFPVGTSGPALIQVEQAKAVCRRCPVREQCLTWALDSDDRWAVLGGTTPTERAWMRRVLAAARPVGQAVA